jgi:hypothetical protein
MNQDTIFTLDEWEKTFGLIKKIDNSVWFKQESYGIDEKLFYIAMKYYRNTLNNKNFIDDTYLVGITHFFYLFINPSFPQDYFRYKVKIDRRD